MSLSPKKNNNPGVIQFDIKEIGVVKSVREFVVLAENMPSCVNGQIVEFDSGLRGIVMGFTEKDVQILMLGPKAQIRAGDKVYSKAKALFQPVGDKFVGRIVNALCEPVDGKGPIESDEMYPVFKDAPGVMDRSTVERTLESGTRIIDTLMPLAWGQRQLLVGDRQTGKTTVVTDAMINQKDKGIICIYCCIGKTYSSLLRTIDLFYEKGVMDYSIIVSGVASTSVGEQYLAPYSAAMLGEYFMRQGKDVLVVFDDLTRHAWVYRQICLLFNRAPGREAYPGDIFYLHSQLMERAAQLNKELGGGAMTFLPIVETLQGDVTGYIPTNLVSMTDGQIYFSTALFNKGQRPAIDVGLSVSRIGNRAQWPAMKGSSQTLRLEFLQYKELVQMTQLRTTDLSKDAEKKLRRGEVITELFIQEKDRPVSMEHQIIDMYALNRGILDDLTYDERKYFKTDFYKKICEWFPALPQEIRRSKIIIDESIANLEESIQFYSSSLKEG
ncbi:MAG: F0F1 ATP synthase subunit alpha [Candidatus Omnitrophota bacterium]